MNKINHEWRDVKTIILLLCSWTFKSNAPPLRVEQTPFGKQEITFIFTRILSSWAKMPVPKSKPGGNTVEMSNSQQQQSFRFHSQLHESTCVGGGQRTPWLELREGSLRHSYTNKLLQKSALKCWISHQVAAYGGWLSPGPSPRAGHRV